MVQIGLFVGLGCAHGIGVGLLLLIINYMIYKKLAVPYWILSFIFAVGFFILEPTTSSIDFIDYLPFPIATYFNKSLGSIFPIFPWLGFVFWGSLFGLFLYKKPNIINNYLFPVITILVGFILKYSHKYFLSYMYELTGIENFNSIYNNNYTFYHLTHVLIIVGILPE